MDSLIEEIIALHHRQFVELAVSPDDREVLIVLGNQDLPHAEYALDLENRTIWRVEFASGRTERLVPLEEDGHAPRWSPDGRQIAFLARDREQMRLWIADREVGDRRAFAVVRSGSRNPLAESSLCWSPDGQQIAVTAVPNGSKAELHEKGAALRNRYYHPEGEEIVVYSAATVEKMRVVSRNPPGFESAVYAVDPVSGAVRRIAVEEGEMLQILQWADDGERLLVRVGADLRLIEVGSGEVSPLYSGPCDLARLVGERLVLARRRAGVIEIGRVNDGIFAPDATVESPGCGARLHAWSGDGEEVFGATQEGVGSYLFAVEIGSGAVRRITEPGTVVRSRGQRCPPCGLHREAGVVFACGGARRPFEIWKQGETGERVQVSRFNEDLADREWPEVRVVEYESDGWRIEGLLVLPLHCDPGKRCPALVFLHGGPELCVSASLAELISARAESAAVLLAAQGYAVLLPNFRGSAGYGEAFERELGNYQIMRKPFRDLMAGADYLVDAGIADPGALGVYGYSFGGQLTAWAVGQTDRFRGAVAAIGWYDVLHDDRSGGKAFHALRPNRLGEADPADMWLCPEVYRQFSPAAHIQAMETPMMIVESGAERYVRGSQARLLFNGLCALGIEAYLVYYPRAYHNGGWNDGYKRDYMRRLVAWFDHCLKGMDLPEWFRGGNSVTSP